MAGDSDVVALLRELIRPVLHDEIRAALAERQAPQVEADDRLLSRTQLAMTLGISAATVTRWRAEGLPAIMLSGAPRYRLAVVRAWLDARQTAAPAVQRPAANENATTAGVVRKTRGKRSAA